MASDGSRAKLAYDWNGSWTTLYSLYSDAALCFHPSVTGFGSNTNSNYKSTLTTDFIPHPLYTTQSTWYLSALQKFGLPLDSRHLYAKSDWQFFAAAVASDEVRTAIIERVARWVNETGTDRPFADLWETEGDGGFPDPWFYARPVVGGHFAGVALGRGCGGGGGTREVEGKVGGEEEVEGAKEADEL